MVAQLSPGAPAPYRMLPPKFTLCEPFAFRNTESHERIFPSRCQVALGDAVVLEVSLPSLNPLLAYASDGAPKAKYNLGTSGEGKFMMRVK